MKKRLLLFVVSFGILAGIIYFSDVGKIIETISRANAILILFLFSFWILDTLMRTFRWQVLLKKLDMKISFSEAWQMFVASMLFSLITPAKSGEISRSLILKRVHKKSFSKSLPSIIVERILDLVVLIILGVFGLIFMASKIPEVSNWFYLGGLIWVLLIIIGIFVVSSREKMEKTFRKLFKLFSFIPMIRSKEYEIEKTSRNLHESFVKYKDLKILLYVSIITFFIWALEGVLVFLVFYSFGISVPFWACLLIVPISVIIGVLSLLPGALGSSELVTILFFTTLFSITLAEVTSVALVVRFILFFPYVILGAILFSLKFK